MAAAAVSRFWKWLAIARRIRNRPVVEEGAIFNGDYAIFFYKVSFIVVPVVVEGFFVRPIRVVVAVDFHRSEDDDGKRVLPIPFCRHYVECVDVLFGAVAVSGGVFQTCLRLVCHAVRNGGEDVRGICLICLFEECGPGDPNGDFPLGGLARDVALFFNRLFKVVRRFVLGVCQGGGNNDVGEANRAAAPDFVAANLRGAFVRVEW